MKVRSRRAASPEHGTASPPLDASRVSALALAMALAPGVYVRNRRFELFTHPSAKRARTRAALLRGVVRQLALATDVSVTASDGDPSAFALRYRIVAMGMSRAVELSGEELSALRVMSARAGIACLPPDDADRARVAAVLAHLLDTPGSPDAAEAAEAIERSVGPVPPQA